MVIHYFIKMTKKKTNKTSCCSDNKKLHLIFIIFIILVTAGVILLSSYEKQPDGLFRDKTKLPVMAKPPVIEMISDTVEVTIKNPKKKVSTEDVLLILDKENSILMPKMTTSEKLVKTFLNHYNQERFKDACDIIIDTKCDDKINGSVARFGEEFGKMDGGYQNVSVKQVDLPDFHSDVVCVGYDYRYKTSTNPNLIHETMSFYLQDGKITYRICEGKTRGDVDLGCPMASRKDFCL